MTAVMMVMCAPTATLALVVDVEASRRLAMMAMVAPMTAAIRRRGVPRSTTQIHAMTEIGARMVTLVRGVSALLVVRRSALMAMIAPMTAVIRVVAVPTRITRPLVTMVTPALMATPVTLALARAVAL